MASRKVARVIKSIKQNLVVKIKLKVILYSRDVFCPFWEGYWMWIDEVYFNTPNVDDAFKVALAVVFTTKWA